MGGQALTKLASRLVFQQPVLDCYCEIGNVDWVPAGDQVSVRYHRLFQHGAASVLEIGLNVPIPGKLFAFENISTGEHDGRMTNRGDQLARLVEVLNKFDDVFIV